MLVVIAGPAADERLWDQHAADIVHWPVSPPRDLVRSTLRSPSEVIVHGSLADLHRVVGGLHRLGRVSEVPVSFVSAGDDEETAMFCQLLALDATIATAINGDIVRLPLVRDDLGGVLLHAGELTRTPSLKPFGAQVFHDDARIADGRIGAIRVVPDYGNTTLGVRASIVPAGRGSTRRSLGRSVQVACDEVFAEVDSIPLEQPLVKRTWYVDDRVHWQVRGATIPLPYEVQIPGARRGPFDLFRRT